MTQLWQGLGWTKINRHAWKLNTGSSRRQRQGFFMHSSKVRLWTPNFMHKHRQLEEAGMATASVLAVPGADRHKTWEQSTVTPLLGDWGRLECSHGNRASFPVSHLSGVQAELPVETLVSMLSELSRLRVSYAWLPLGGDWWCRMEWWTVGDRSVQEEKVQRQLS